MRKLFFLILSIICFNVDLLAQDSTTSFKHVLKVNISYVNSSDFNSYEIGNLAPSLIIRSGNFIHEIELNQFEVDRFISYNSILDPKEHKVIEFGLKYEFGYLFLPKRIISPYFGLSLNQFLRTEKVEPSHPFSFPAKYTDYDGNIAFSPGAFFNITNRILFTVVVPIDFFGYSADYSRIDNPSIPESQQRNTDWTSGFRGPDKFHLRLGVGYKF